MIRTTGKSGCSCFALRCGRKYIHWNRVVYICSIKFIIRNVHQNVSHLLSWSLGRGRRWGCGWRCCRGRRRSRCFNKAFYCSIQRIFRGINSALGFFCRKSRFCCGKSSLDSFPGVCGVFSFLYCFGICDCFFKCCGVYCFWSRGCFLGCCKSRGFYCIRSSGCTRYNIPSFNVFNRCIFSKKFRFESFAVCSCFFKICSIFCIVSRTRCYCNIRKLTVCNCDFDINVIFIPCILILIVFCSSGNMSRRLISAICQHATCSIRQCGSREQAHGHGSYHYGC